MNDRISETPADIVSQFNDSELVLALVGAVGAQLEQTSQYLRNGLKSIGFKVHEITISSDVIPLFVDTKDVPSDKNYDRISQLMLAGNKARNKAKDDSILSLGVATRIHRLRIKETGSPEPKPRTAYIVRSLKHPEEVKRLRDIYGNGFYLIAAHNDYEKRLKRLMGFNGMTEEQANDLIDRDFDDKELHGQRLNKTFSLADFFIRVDAGGNDAEENTMREVERMLNIICGHPFVTPTFDEYAMYFAFTSALRSADLSRQVGAVIAIGEQIVANGANDCPKFGGGLYWPLVDGSEVNEVTNGRDFTRSLKGSSGKEVKGYDSNRIERERIIEGILDKLPAEDHDRLREVLKFSPISDITEYGRVVHAEMDALLACARIGISCREGTIYSTTFPCHNCAKHIIAAGITRVVYIEPYPKSKALEFHDDAISFGFKKIDEKVHFEPFVGVGPRRFFDLFSYRHGSGKDVQRAKDGLALKWEAHSAVLKLQMSPYSYLDLELAAQDMVAFHELTPPLTNTRDFSDASSS